MSVHFELNIDSYTVDEIEKLINLNQPYTSSDVLKSANVLRDQILLDGSIDQEKKKEVIEFIKQIVSKLNNHLTMEKRLQTSDIFESSSNIQILRKDTGDYPTSAAEKINARDNTKMKSLYAPDTMSKVISLDTTFRKNYHTTNSADVIWDIPTQIKNVVSMELVSLEIPNTYFQISKKNGNNHLYFKCTNSKIDSVVFDNQSMDAPQNTIEGIITIPDGNYDLNQIENEINLQFKKIADTIPGMSSTAPIEFTVDSKSNRCIFALADIDNNINFKNTDNLLIRFDYPSESVKNADGTDNWDLTKPETKPIQLKLGWLLGFRFAQYTGKSKDIVIGSADPDYNVVEYKIDSDNFTVNSNTLIKNHVSTWNHPSNNTTFLDNIYKDRIYMPNLLFKNIGGIDISLNPQLKLVKTDKIRLSIIAGAYNGFYEDGDSTVQTLSGYDLTNNDIKLLVKASTGETLYEKSLKDISNGIISSPTPEDNGQHSYNIFEFSLSSLTAGEGQNINLEFEISSANNGGTNYVLAINKLEVLYDTSISLSQRAADYAVIPDTDGATGVAFVGEGIYDSIGNQYLYVVVDDFNYNNSENVMAIYNESINNSYILARITKTGWAPDIRGDLWDVNSISNDMSTKVRKYFGPVDIQKLHIKIIDKYGRIVDLNEMDFSMALKLEYLYE